MVARVPVVISQSKYSCSFYICKIFYANGMLYWFAVVAVVVVAVVVVAVVAVVVVAASLFLAPCL